MLTVLGSALVGIIGFILGRLWAESERILSEKRKCYVEFLSTLPPLSDTYKDTTKDEFYETLRPAVDRVPGLLFYADKPVVMAWGALQQKYDEAHTRLTLAGAGGEPEIKALSKAQNDLILEMRRDAFRWSVFNYSGKSRVPERLDFSNS